jgi:hypothetical protein
MIGNGNKEFEKGEIQLWLGNKIMIEEKKGVPFLQVRKKALCECYRMFNKALNPVLNTHCVRV